MGRENFEEKEEGLPVFDVRDKRDWGVADLGRRLAGRVVGAALRRGTARSKAPASSYSPSASNEMFRSMSSAELCMPSDDSNVDEASAL